MSLGKHAEYGVARLFPLLSSPPEPLRFGFSVSIFFAYPSFEGEEGYLWKCN